MYIYVSNETPNVDVFFDNLQVTHVRGPLLEETHYYPFGLTMAGISSKAAGKLENRFKFNGNKLESGEWSDGTGLEMYDFNARTYDQQLGRFMQIDPLSDQEEQESWNSYHFGFNNPILNADPDGTNPIGSLKLGRLILRVVRAENKLAELEKITLRDVVEAFSPITIDRESLAKSQEQLRRNVNASKQASDSKPANVAEQKTDGLNTNSKEEKSSGDAGTRRKNRLPDKGEPNTTATNTPGTTTKKYGPDGKVQKEFNKGHQGNKVPKNERNDHVHDYKPSTHPNGNSERMPGRPPKKNELKKDFNQ